MPASSPFEFCFEAVKLLHTLAATPTPNPTRQVRLSLERGGEDWGGLESGRYLPTLFNRERERERESQKERARERARERGRERERERERDRDRDREI